MPKSGYGSLNNLSIAEAIFMIAIFFAKKKLAISDSHFILGLFRFGEKKLTSVSAISDS